MPPLSKQQKFELLTATFALVEERGPTPLTEIAAHLGIDVGTLRDLIDPLLFLEALDLVAARAAVEANEKLSASFEFGIIQVGGRGIGGPIAAESHQVAGNIPRLLEGEPQARHGRHLLDDELVTVVGAPAVLEIEDEG